MTGSPVVAVHGGAGGLPRGGPEAERPYRAALAAAVEAARSALRAGAGALDAAQAAVELLEDAPLFNAGRGSVLTGEGAVEMDAALMCGRERRAGAVAAVTGVRHPVALARAVMESTPHVLLAGPGAERLADRLGLERMDPDWFVTDRERERHARAAGTSRGAADAADAADAGSGSGTVGAVVLDASGALAAATSTGGVRGQLPGRVGDSPLPGAGTWADDRCAVSATGHGEAVMRVVAAHEVAALVRHAGLPLAEAAGRTIDGLDPPGSGGLIAVDAGGALAMPFATPAMHRGWAVGDGPVETAIGP
ncbi:MAG TPA: isoaspartyl peptidase/L-asparaginase [Thermoleophilaceae bacterium]